jgi:hypothetical protein
MLLPGEFNIITNKLFGIMFFCIFSPYNTGMNDEHDRRVGDCGHGDRVMRVVESTYYRDTFEKKREKAEREGFEPSVPSQVHTLSKRARSATLTPLRIRTAKKPTILVKAK